MKKGKEKTAFVSRSFYKSLGQAAGKIWTVFIGQIRVIIRFA
jgi:hypothetical protein